MGAAAATAAAPATRADTADQGSPAASAQALVPFPRAAKEHTEFMFDSGPLTPGQEMQPVDIPAYGFLRGLHLEVVVTSSGNSAAVTAGPDDVFGALSSLQIQDVNSTPIYGPVNGYEAYIADKYLANRTNFDPKLIQGGFALSTVGGGATAGSGRFTVRLGIEAIASSGLGALANANSSTTYKLRLTAATLATMFGVVPNGAVTVRVVGYLEAWSVPAATDWRGRPQEQLPPGNGTTNYVSRFIFGNVVVGANTIRLPRVGNYIRSLLLIFRTAGGSRTAFEAAGMPNPINLFVDTRLFHSQTPILNRRYMAERQGMIGTTLDTAGCPDSGLVVFDGNHDLDGHYGNESGNLWLPTLQSTRLELQFISATAGSVTILTNDVAPPAAVAV